MPSIAVVVQGLVMVTVMGLLTIFTPTAPKFIGDGAASIAPAPPTIPLNATVACVVNVIELTARIPVAVLPAARLAVGV